MSCTAVEGAHIHAVEYHVNLNRPVDVVVVVVVYAHALTKFVVSAVFFTQATASPCHAVEYNLS